MRLFPTLAWHNTAALLPIMLLTAPVIAAEPDPLARCTTIPDREERWRCYDEAAAQPVPPPADNEPAKDECGAEYTALSRQWNTLPKCQSNLYRLVPYRQNYIIARYSNSPNNEPNSVNFGRAPDEHLDHTELKFQLSLKVKVAEEIGDFVDLWVGYTQQSNWQAFNAANSRPFRETDYEPEVIATVPLRTESSFFGLTPRLINVGLVHQSNGQSDPLSGSWNRAYVQFGADWQSAATPKQLAFLVRAWYRIPEAAASDNNPDIEHYMGYGDLLMFWTNGQSNVSALVRDNLQSQNNRGFVRLDWSIPIARVPQLRKIGTVEPLTQHELRFYVQVFACYGETLLDYNHYQTGIGIGFMVTDWM